MQSNETLDKVRNLFLHFCMNDFAKSCVLAKKVFLSKSDETFKTLPCACFYSFQIIVFKEKFPINNLMKSKYSINFPSLIWKIESNLFISNAYKFISPEGIALELCKVSRFSALRYPWVVIDEYEQGQTSIK